MNKVRVFEEVPASYTDPFWCGMQSRAEFKNDDWAEVSINTDEIVYKTVGLVRELLRREIQIK